MFREAMDPVCSTPRISRGGPCAASVGCACSAACFAQSFSRLPRLRFPFASEALRLRDLRGCHLCSHGLSVLDGSVARSTWRQPDNREAEPHVCANVVLQDTPTFPVQF